MVATIQGMSQSDMEAALTERKNAGQTVVWAHCDSYWAEDDPAYYSAGLPVSR